MEMEFQQAIYLAAQIPAPQGPRFSPAPEVHIPQEQCGSALRPGRQGGWRPGLPAPLCPQLPTLRQSRKTWDPLFPATPWDPEDGSAPTAIPNPRTPVLTLSGPQPPTPQSLSIRLFLAAVRTGRGSSIMALVSRSRLPLHRSGREVGANSRPFPLLSRQATLPREARAGRCKAHTLSPRWSFSSRTRKEGVRTPAPLPLLFSSASSQSAPSSGTSRGEGGGGRWPRGRRLQARGERDPRLQPRPAMRGSPSPPLSPKAWGEGAPEPSPAPPHPPRRRKPGRPPLRTPADPRRRPPTTAPRPAGLGGRGPGLP